MHSSYLLEVEGQLREFSNSCYLERLAERKQGVSDDVIKGRSFFGNSSRNMVWNHITRDPPS